MGGSTPIQVDHVRSNAERKTEKVSSSEKKSQDITNEGRVDNFEGPGEMQRRRRSLSKAGRSRDTSRARETITSAINAKENKESKASGTRSSSRAVRWWWKGKRNEGRGGEAGPGTSKSL